MKPPRLFNNSAPTSDRQAVSAWYVPLILGLSVFFACLFGIYTRPVGFLATLWPANALMLGLLLQLRGAASPLGWLLGAMAYLAADLMTGSSLLKAVLLNGTNLLGVATGYLIASRLPVDLLRLRQPNSILYLIFVSTAAAAVTGLAGAIINPILFKGSALAGFAFWFATEAANYIAILPVILSAPAVKDWSLSNLKRFNPVSWHTALPLIVFVLSCVLASLIAGPGAIAFPVPALLWCGLVYAIFPTAVLTLLFSCWSLIVVSARFLPNPNGVHDEYALVSLRLGSTLIAVAPIMLSTVMQNRNELLNKLRTLATHDPLTGAKNRYAFYEDAQRLLNESQAPVAVLALDLDHFKAVNDGYGHAVGDEVLVATVARIKHCRRGTDLLGRLGGEEFTIMAPNCSQAEAMMLAERLLAALADSPIALRNTGTITVTSSIGVTLSKQNQTAHSSLEELLSQADAALYRAKTKGRNRIEMAEALIRGHNASSG